jgi:adenine phosphoribosyltransferase
MSYKDFITEHPNFPIQGVDFKDLSPLLADEDVFRSLLEDMGDQVEIPDYWLGIDSRGFIFAAGLATYYGGGVICARKKGKTPGDKVSMSYDLEYGSATLELPRGIGEVVIVDDVLASGGTLQATNKLAKEAGYDIIGNLVVVDLQFVPRVDDFDLKVGSVVEYE